MNVRTALVAGALLVAVAGGARGGTDATLREISPVLADTDVGAAGAAAGEVASWVPLACSGDLTDKECAVDDASVGYDVDASILRTNAAPCSTPRTDTGSSIAGSGASVRPSATSSCGSASAEVVYGDRIPGVGTVGDMNIVPEEVYDLWRDGPLAGPGSEWLLPELPEAPEFTAETALALWAGPAAADPWDVGPLLN